MGVCGFVCGGVGGWVRVQVGMRAPWRGISAWAVVREVGSEMQVNAAQEGVRGSRQSRGAGGSPPWAARGVRTNLRRDSLPRGHRECD
eukprot:3886315-Prymnesium_polylepis.1